MSDQDQEGFLEYHKRVAREIMASGDKDQAVTEFMKSHGFEWLPRKQGFPTAFKGYWVRKDNPSDHGLTSEQALFFYTICQKVEREAREDENNTAFLRIFQIARVKGLTAERLVKYHDDREAEIENQSASPQDTTNHTE